MSYLVTFITDVRLLATIFVWQISIAGILAGGRDELSKPSAFHNHVKHKNQSVSRSSDSHHLQTHAVPFRQPHREVLDPFNGITVSGVTAELILNAHRNQLHPRHQNSSLPSKLQRVTMEGFAAYHNEAVNQHTINTTTTAEPLTTQSSRWTIDKSPKNVKELKEKVHLRLGTRETFDCFRRTVVQRMYTEKLDDVFGIFIDEYAKKATHFYKELYAKEGIIEGEFSRDSIQNMSRKHNVTVGYKAFDNMGCIGFCCAIRVTVPEGKNVVIEISQISHSGLWLYDERWTETALLNNQGEVLVFIGSSNVINIILTVEYNMPSTDRYGFRFYAIPASALQVRWATSNKGVIQTPQSQSTVVYLTPLINPWAYVKVPKDHVIMASSLNFAVILHNVALLAADRGNETLATITPEMVNPPLAAIYDTSLLLVYVYGDLAGFSLHFSFHNNSARPVKVLPRSETWNCSVPFLSDFLYHLSCNLEVECHDIEDEMNCSHTSDLCGPGYLTAGGGCFFYVRRQKERLSWNEASDICLSRGGRLASLNVKSKWTDTERVLPLPRCRVHYVFVGLKSAASTLPLWYTGMYQWVDSTTAFYTHIDIPAASACIHTCAYIRIVRCRKSGVRSRPFTHNDCDQYIEANILCEIAPLPPTRTINQDQILNDTSHWPWHDAEYVKCPSGHYTHQFLACDVRSSCWSSHHSGYCDASETSRVTSFQCADRIQPVPFTLVCDHRADCIDGSDEDFCVRPLCQAGQFSCGDKQCIPSAKVCDGWGDCHKEEDEDKCTLAYENKPFLPPPALVSLSNFGHLKLQPLQNMPSTANRAGICPPSHFQCMNDGYCLPMFLRCNDVYDCPSREDETGCSVCPGFYRCRASIVCLYYSDLCDGHAHCPQHDDEVMCGCVCPSTCLCHGMSFFCRHSFIASVYPLLRFLDAGSSAMTPMHLTRNRMLVYLSLADCGLLDLKSLELPNLLSLDIRDNRLSTMNKVNLIGVSQLRELSVAGNPMAFVLESAEGFDSLRTLDLSRVVMKDLNVTALSAFTNLQTLNLSYCGLQRVQGDGFRVAKKLQVLDLRGCPMTWFSHQMLQDLNQLELVYALNFKVCCPAVLPVDFNTHNCFAPSDIVSSCDDLLRGNEYKIILLVLCLVAVFGNAVSFIFRTFISKRENKLGYGNFVTHLSISDFLMGIYLVIIGAADLVYHGTFLWNDVAWKHSNACKFAGFLSLLSSEVSALMMCLITLDRFLVLRFPFSRLHFTASSAQAVSIAVWIVGVIIVSVPLLPMAAHWNFYSQTGICIPLPISRGAFAGYNYSFSILIIFNFILFIFISLGQLSIYWSVRANSMSLSNTSKKTKDLTIARRLITVALTDFFCWFPIGVLGVLASYGIPIPGEINVVVAICVLPLNAAVNPGLYTFNVIMERRNRAQEEKLRTLLLAQLKARS